MNLQVVALLCARDVEQALGLLGSSDKMGFVLGFFYDFMPQFKHHFEVRRILFGLSAVLCADKGLIPSELLDSMGHLFARTVPLVLLDVKH